jgi:hypothetical protein
MGFFKILKKGIVCKRGYKAEKVEAVATAILLFLHPYSKNIHLSLHIGLNM